MSLVGSPDRAVVQAINSGSVPSTDLISRGGWTYICNVRGRNFGAVDDSAWQNLCAQRGQLQQWTHSPADTRTVGYRAVWRVRDTDPITLAERNVRVWLSEKLGGAGALDAWDGLSARFDDQYSIVVVGLAEQDRERRRLYRLTDASAAGTFEISIYATTGDRRIGGTLVIEGARSDATPEQALDGVGTPRIVSQILEEIDVYDGRTRLTGKPRVVRQQDVSEVLEAIADPERASSVIVASSIDPAVDAEWLKLMTQLTRNSVGVASTFVVYGDAVEVLNERLPDSHRVPRGNVRTFVPGARLDDPDDGIAHRFVGPATLARAIRNGRVQGLLPTVHSRGPRTVFLERGLPADVRRSIELLDKQERAHLRTLEVERRKAIGNVEQPGVVGVEVIDIPTIVDVAPVPQPAAPPDSVSTPELTAEAARDEPAAADRGLIGILRAIRRLIGRWLRRESFTEADLRDLDDFVSGQVAEVQVASEQIDEVAAENAELRQQLDALRESLNERDYESALTADEVRQLSYQNQLLRRLLRDAQIYDVVDDGMPDWQPPTDVDELVARLTPGSQSHMALARVVFTGKPDVAAEVRKRDPYGKYARDLWDFVHVLYDYAELKASQSFSGNVHMYLTDDDVSGFKCSPKRHAGRESDSVIQNDAWRAERVHGVPVAVASDGLALMDAHFKPTHRDMFAPRMHYYDDTQNTGKIYVGYIGKHLTTTLSN